MGEEMENPSLVGVTREGFFCGGGIGGETAKNEPKRGGGSVAPGGGEDPLREGGLGGKTAKNEPKGGGVAPGGGREAPYRGKGSIAPWGGGYRYFFRRRR